MQSMKCSFMLIVPVLDPLSYSLPAPLSGRLASFSHVVYGSQRVMKSCAVHGQAAGTAAAYAVRNGEWSNHPAACLVRPASHSMTFWKCPRQISATWKNVFEKQGNIWRLHTANLAYWAPQTSNFVDLLVRLTQRYAHWNTFILTCSFFSWLEQKMFFFFEFVIFY